VSAAHCAVLGVVQGLTEFIPISSSAHLVLVPDVLGWEEPSLAFDVLLHAASLMALVAYFWHDLWGIVAGVLAGDGRARHLAILLIVGTIPAAIAGVLLGSYFERSFEDPRATAVQLIITAAILVAAERVLAFNTRRAERAQARLKAVEDLSAADAGVIGVAQAVAILPGISRSGASLGAGLGLAMDRADAARFAFLLAVPALFGAALVKIPDLEGSSLGVGAAVAGFVASLVVSYATIWGLIRYLKTRTLYPFAAYCLVAGALFYVFV
jgi:undecaprenyl-diphosphatase